MARLSETELEQIKHNISLLRLIESQGYELKRQGKDYVTRCPFHDDATPSLVITPDKNLFHCFGCNAAGTVIDWVMKSEGVSFRHAVELLSNDYQPRASDKPPIKRATVNKLDTPFTTTEDQVLLNRVIDYYHKTLKQSPDALAYCKKRGISANAIDHFKLGVANRTLGYRLPKANRKQGAALRGQLQKIGIYRESGHEHFSGSLIIPIIDEYENVQEVYGRKLLDTLRKGTPKHLYLPGSHQGIFNHHAFKVSNEIVVCESLIDALTFWSHGYRNVTSSYGTSGFTDEHVKAMQTHAIKRVLIAYDRDEAGEAAAQTLSKQLIDMGIECYRIHFPKGMDANEYALSVTPANKSLGLVIRKAHWLGTGKAPASNVSNNAIPFAANVPESLPATPLPQAPTQPAIDTEQTDKETFFTFDNRRYRVRGLDKNQSVNTLKINLLVTDDNNVHVDSFDLYQSRPRASFIKHASQELCIEEEVIKKDLSKVLLQLETLQEQQLTKTAPSKEKVLSEAEHKAALTLLQSPDLLNRIIEDVKASGLVGEDHNALVAYLAAVSRKLDKPLAIIIQSTSAAGKSSLMDAILNLMPEDERVQYSAMTGQSLFYMGETSLKHKILAIAEQAGAENASYALKLLQSEGELTIASTGKDDSTGDLITKEYHVEGPVMLILTTTAIDIDEELMNRCLVLTVNESRAQTQAIHQLQRQQRTLQGLLNKQSKQGIQTLHRHAQQLLRALPIVNPYADQLTFVDSQTRTRRDHEKYLTLIDSIALLHQYQRETKTVQHDKQTIEYIEVTLEDIEQANQLAHDVLGRSLDELPPQTRKLLTLMNDFVMQRCEAQSRQRIDVRFSRRALRDATRWGNTQLKVHLARLVEMEYILIHRRGNTFFYELLYDDQSNTTTHLSGLIDTHTLKKQTYDAKRSGQNGQRPGPGRPLVGGQSGGGRSTKSTVKASIDAPLDEAEDDTEKNAVFPATHNTTSYTQAAIPATTNH